MRHLPLTARHRAEDAPAFPAHGWVGLGRIVAAVRSAQLAQWLEAWGEPEPAVATLAADEVVPGLAVDGPAPELADEMQALHRARVEGDRARG